MKLESRSRTLFWALAISFGGALTFLSAVPSWADARGHGYGKHPSAVHFIKHVLKAKDELGLTDEQETRLRGIKTAFKKARITKKAEVGLAKVDLHELLHGEQAAMGEIEANVKKVYALKAELRVASIKARGEAKAVLTADQMEKLRALREQRKKERLSHGDRRHHGRSKGHH